MLDLTSDSPQNKREQEKQIMAFTDRKGIQMYFPGGKTMQESNKVQHRCRTAALFLQKQQVNIH